MPSFLLPFFVVALVGTAVQTNAAGGEGYYDGGNGGLALSSTPETRGDRTLTHLRLRWIPQHYPNGSVVSSHPHARRRMVLQTAAQKRRPVSMRRAMLESDSGEEGNVTVMVTDLEPTVSIVKPSTSLTFLAQHPLIRHVNLFGHNPNQRAASSMNSHQRSVFEALSSSSLDSFASPSFIVAVPKGRKNALERDLEGLFTVEETRPTDHLSETLVEGFSECRRRHNHASEGFANVSLTFIYEPSAVRLPSLKEALEALPWEETSSKCRFEIVRSFKGGRHGAIFNTPHATMKRSMLGHDQGTAGHFLSQATAAAPFIRAKFSDLCDCQQLILSLAGKDGCRHVELTPTFTTQNHIGTVSLQSDTDSSRPIWAHDLTGRGQIIGVGDTGLDHDSCYFRDDAEAVTHYPALNWKHRKVISYVPCVDGDKIDASDGVSAHGTHVTGSAAGNALGNSDAASQYNGMAKDAKIVFHDLTMSGSSDLVLPPDIGDYYAPSWAVGARISSNSWGGSASKSYSFTDKSSDMYLYEHQELLAVFAAGNYATKGVIIPGSGKNVLSVGAHQNSPYLSTRENVASFSARGPTYDGRIKPDLCAPGQPVMSAKSDGNLNSKNCNVESKQGTSMATPLVSGSAALLRQFLQEGFYPLGGKGRSATVQPSGPLLKAMLMHGTTQMRGQAGPDSTRGFGRLELQHLFNFDDSENKGYAPLVFEDMAVLHEGMAHEYCFKMDHNTMRPDEIKVTLVWHDSGAAAEGTNTLPIVNDLDLTLVNKKGVAWVGNAFTTDAAGPGMKWDRANNAEQVRIVKSVWSAGDGFSSFKVIVHAHRIMDGARYGGQPYALVASAPYLERDVSGASCAANTCPNECSGVGQCVAGSCVCPPSHHHVDCSLCNGTSICHGRGTCNLQMECSCSASHVNTEKDRSCGVCADGFYGPLCDFDCKCARGTCDTELGQCTCGNPNIAGTSVAPKAYTSDTTFLDAMGEGSIGSCYAGQRCDACCVDHAGPACDLRSHWCLPKASRVVNISSGPARTGILQINGEPRYHNGDSCKWQLKVTEPGKESFPITISVLTHFQVEDPYDYLSIFGESGKLVARATGTKAAGTVLYKGKGPLTITFFADLEGDGRGFGLQYSTDLPDSVPTVAPTTAPPTTTPKPTTPRTTRLPTPTPNNNGGGGTRNEQRVPQQPMRCLSDDGYCSNVSGFPTCIAASSRKGSPYVGAVYCECDVTRPHACAETEDQRWAIATHPSRQTADPFSDAGIYVESLPMKITAANPNVSVNKNDPEDFFTRTRFIVVFIIPFFLGALLVQTCNRKVVGAIIDEEIGEIDD